MALLSRDAIQGLLQALSDPAPAVRAAALRALVNLPLQRDAWWAVAGQVNSLLDQAPQGDSFEKQTLGGVPYSEVIQAAVHVPSQIMRRRLADLLSSPDADLRYAVMIALADALDLAAIPALLQFLEDSQPSPGVSEGASGQGGNQFPTETDNHRKTAALSLSRLNLIGYEEQIEAAIQQELDPEVRFWLALGLAGTGRINAFQASLKDLGDGKFYLSEFDWDAQGQLHELSRRRDFHGDLIGLKSLLKDVAEDEHSQARGIAAQLSYGFQTSQPLEKPAPSGNDPAQAAELAGYLEKYSPYEHGWPYLSQNNIQQLRPLDPASATHLISSLFKDATDRIPDIPFDNELVGLIFWFDTPFQPDIPALFDSYKRIGDYPQPLAWQIAWTVSRSGPEALVTALEPNLQSKDETERQAAARLIEEAARYLNQDYPPVFGGGEPPPDTLPADMDWIDLPRSGPPGGELEMVERPQPEAPAIETHGQKAEPPGKTHPPERVVNTGFAPEEQADNLIEPAAPLRTGTAYYFWIDIGAPVAQSGELLPADIPSVPAETTLTVVLFGYQDGIQLTPGADRGELYLKADGTVIAQSQPLGEHPPASNFLATRLFFPVRTQAAPGHYALRCNIYWGRILLQSRLVEADVLAPAAQTGNRERYWWSALDYTLTNQVNAAHLVQLEPGAQETHKLSLLLNDNGDGTNSFFFYGNDGTEILKQDDVRFGEGELSGMIEQARQQLRWVSWGNTDEWLEGEEYCFKTGQLDKARLQDDLVKLAKWGREFYVQVGSRLGNMQVQKLQNLMVAPGYVQIAMKESPNYILPAGMIYDYPLDTVGTQYKLCPEFARNLDAGLPLEDSLCFQGQCPSRGDNTAVCPSGFWGFRHYLGMPLSVHLAPQVPPTIDYNGSLQMTMGESTDMQLLSEHEPAMQHLQDGLLQVQLCSHRTDIFNSMEKSPHLVYFYCHGGLQNDAPFLEVGPKQNPELILPSNLVEYVYWQGPRPLVFLNGCHTTAVDPLKALQFIRPLVEECQCAGVIGTEITIFEELATAFAEEFFRRLLKGETTGKALRGARLKILSAGNPLGLVYIPFVLGTITLKNLSAAADLGVVPKRASVTGIEQGDGFVTINGVKVPKHP